MHTANQFPASQSWSKHFFLMLDWFGLAGDGEICDSAQQGFDLQLFFMRYYLPHTCLPCKQKSLAH